MELRLVQAPSLQLLARCLCCTGHLEAHEPGCPYDILRQYQKEQLQGPRCVACGEGMLLQNTADFLECNKRRCRIQFSRSEVADGSNPDALLRRVVVDFVKNEHFMVLQLPTKGRGEFSHLQVLANLKHAVVLAREAMRARRALERRTKTS
jgi:hypothetical protein